MSLVGFKARNHEQQVLVRGARSDVDDRETTAEIFDPLHAWFGFTIDVAAAAHNAKLPRFYSTTDDGLEQPWVGERVWCNPPYSNIEPWIAKAHTSVADLVVMLLPANRTEQGWWQRQVEPYRDIPGGLRCEFLQGRLRFLKPGQKHIGPNERPPFGCCLLILGARRGQERGVSVRKGGPADDLVLVLSVNLSRAAEIFAAVMTVTAWTLIAAWDLAHRRRPQRIGESPWSRWTR